MVHSGRYIAVVGPIVIGIGFTPGVRSASTFTGVLAAAAASSR